MSIRKPSRELGVAIFCISVAFGVIVIMATAAYLGCVYLAPVVTQILRSMNQ